VDTVGNAYVVGTGSRTVFKIRPTGLISTIMDQIGHDIDSPLGIAVDAAGNAFVSGGYSSNAFKIAPDCNDNDIPDGTDIAAGTSIDCNGNIAPDECDTIENGDANGDADVDLDDYAAFFDCAAGADQEPTPSSPECASACLSAFDLDGDNDVDLIDFALLQVVFTGRM
jgi:DNA-binding beta-propeller fold protein YncE